MVSDFTKKKLKETFIGIAILASPVITNQDKFGELGLTCHRVLSAAFAVTPHLGCYDHHLVWGGQGEKPREKSEKFSSREKEWFCCSTYAPRPTGFFNIPRSLSHVILNYSK